MKASSRPPTGPRKSPRKRLGLPSERGRDRDSARQLSGPASHDNITIVSSDLPDPIPILPEEVELMRHFFDDLITRVLRSDS